MADTNIAAIKPATPITSMTDFMDAIWALKEKYGDRLDVVTATSEGERNYNDCREIFNTYFDIMPTAIIYCTITEQVAEITNLVARTTFNFLYRVRSGGYGHDHEGECLANGAIVIDLSDMEVDPSIKPNNKVLRNAPTGLAADRYEIYLNEDIDKYIKIFPKEEYAVISPGLPFEQLINAMNNSGVGIPHGTCASVHLSGYVFGGGWGPWTRLKGMGCESLAGVIIVLGNGEVKTLIDNTLLKTYNGKPVPAMSDDERKLLWALRGGGGYGYGIITQVIMKTFPLPAQTTKFTVAWNAGLAVKVLERWEDIIMSRIGKDYNIDLLGTNLMIMGKPYDNVPIEKSRHQMAFYGYYKSDNAKEDLDAKLTEIINNEWFNTEDLKGYTITFDNGESQGPGLNKISWGRFAAWDRVVRWEKQPNADEVKKLLGSKMDNAVPGSVALIPPEHDNPAPHKISSRLVRSDNKEIVSGTGNDMRAGLGKNGRETLIRSLESVKIKQEGMDNGMNCYVTLGAISGVYYDKEYVQKEFPYGCSFPYSYSPYTIQYQVWWNQNDVNPAVNPYINDALDWIHDCRTMDFPETKGAFISFKDDTIPTETYFQESFDKLKEIKLTLCHDPRNIFSTKKTII